MKAPKILGVLAIICGVVLIFASGAIADKVAEGRGEIRRGQRKVDAANKVFSLTPPTKELGKIITGSSQDKIDAGIIEADKYDQLAHNLKTGGYGLIALGALFFLVGLLRTRR